MGNSVTFDYTDGKLTFNMQVEDIAALKTLIFSIFSKKLNPIVFSSFSTFLKEKEIQELNDIIPIIEDQNNSAIVKPSEFK